MRIQSTGYRYHHSINAEGRRALWRDVRGLPAEADPGGGAGGGPAAGAPVPGQPAPPEGGGSSEEAQQVLFYTVSRIRINGDLQWNGFPGSDSVLGYRIWIQGSQNGYKKVWKRVKISSWKEHLPFHESLMDFTWAWESLIKVKRRKCQILLLILHR